MIADRNALIFFLHIQTIIIINVITCNTGLLYFCIYIESETINQVMDTDRSLTQEWRKELPFFDYNNKYFLQSFSLFVIFLSITN